jgi:hypothetical protein
MANVEVRNRGRIANRESVMSIVPLDLQRKFERRWAARFSRPPDVPQAHRPESQDHPLAAVAKSKRKTRRVEAAGLRPLPTA